MDMLFDNDFQQPGLVKRVLEYKNNYIIWNSIKRQVAQLYAMAKVYLNPEFSLFLEIEDLHKSVAGKISGDILKTNRNLVRLKGELDNYLSNH